jgi:transposase InsO family protein
MAISKRDLLLALGAAAAGTVIGREGVASGGDKAPPHPASAHDMDQFPAHWHGAEQIAFLVYPQFTALDLVGPHYMLSNLMGATTHIVAKSREPVVSDMKLAILHIKAPHTGSLVAVDTFHVGTLKGVGKIYLQTAIDCHSRHAWARLYPSKLPITAVHLMNNDVLPTFETANAKIDVVLSDNGREYCGRPDRHPYELYLQLEEIEHRTTRVKRPQSNGIVERFHRTLLDEHFRVEGRKTWFDTIEEMQAVLDDYLAGYNQRRPHQGRGMKGRTPARAFRDGLPRKAKQQLQKEIKATPENQAAQPAA